MERCGQSARLSGPAGWLRWQDCTDSLWCAVHVQEQLAAVEQAQAPSFAQKALKVRTWACNVALAERRGCRLVHTSAHGQLGAFGHRSAIRALLTTATNRFADCCDGAAFHGCGIQ